MEGKLYTMQAIAPLLQGVILQLQSHVTIKSLVFDTRSLKDAKHALFFAIKGQKDGHQYLKDAYQAGVRNFIVSNASFLHLLKESNVLLVNDTLIALKQLAASHRTYFQLPVIGITGSNGKTIVKEWLYQLLAPDYSIARSPKSYNSQIGVPLSVWQINENHTLGIFEAGISKPHEMEALELLVKPNIGILTNITEAHATGFSSKEQKLKEKLKLFQNSDTVIYSPDYTFNLHPDEIPGKKKFTWSFNYPADLKIIKEQSLVQGVQLTALFKEKEISCMLPFSDKASIENGIICWATLLCMGYSVDEVGKRMAKLTKVGMRLELKSGINDCSLIDDSYNADIVSLSIALDFLNQQQQNTKKTVILSDIYETGKTNAYLYGEVASLLKQKNISRLIGIGNSIKEMAHLFEMETQFFDDTNGFITAYPNLHFEKETILIKGSRKFEFEKISKLLSEKVHDTVLEINLAAIASNLNFYRRNTHSNVKLMAMVKAFSYGSGSFEIANLLQFHKVDYLAVAYTDEGIALREGGISLPIMVMSPEPSAFDAILKFKLEPEIYSLEIFKQFLEYLPQSIKNYPIHLKLDTGMHRLGFEMHDISELQELLKDNSQIRVVSIFSHLAASGDPLLKEFTEEQIAYFNRMVKELKKSISCNPLLHILNTSGITQFPENQMDMVRLGIGLYGYDSTPEINAYLETAMVLKTTVTQVKQLQANETVGYSRKGKLLNGGQIATVRIGYADGYSRAFGNGVGKMLVNGEYVSTIGNICMDMCMLDVTGLSIKAGDEVIVFNEILTIEELAQQIGTIPYEILTNISQRVKRVYFYE